MINSIHPSDSISPSESDSESPESQSHSVSASESLSCDRVFVEGFSENFKTVTSVEGEYEGFYVADGTCNDNPVFKKDEDKYLSKLGSKIENFSDLRNQRIGKEG